LSSVAGNSAALPGLRSLVPVRPGQLTMAARPIRNDAAAGRERVRRQERE
jgi:hypothetical protein